MSTSFDCIVVGLGAVGSAATYQLAKRGFRVLGLDRYAPPHTLGSSHGGSRIIRKAYFEGAKYVPLLERAYTLWHDLEAETEQTLLHQTGGLMIGPAASQLVAGAKQSAETHNLPFEMLDAGVLRKRHPAFHVPDDHVALWEAEAGYLIPEQCIEVLLTQAQHAGATLRTNEPVLSWSPEGNGFLVRTEQATYTADSVVLALGGWLKRLVPDMNLPLRLERQVQAWFHPQTHATSFTQPHFPIFMWAHGEGPLLYGFPDKGKGVKVALHHGAALVDDPDDLDREPNAADEIAILQPLRRLFPHLTPSAHAMAICFYTNTPDEDYLIDRHPQHPRVVIASPCSGHGFKGANAVGEAVADLVEGQPLRFDTTPFQLSRFALA